MIEARGLVKRYGATAAVNDLSFTIRPGLVTGFLGPNRAGKTTTMRLILGLDYPSAGTVTVNGKPYAQMASPMHEVGALLDAGAVHGGRTARNHLLCLAQARRRDASRVGARRTRSPTGTGAPTTPPSRNAPPAPKPSATRRRGSPLPPSAPANYRNSAPARSTSRPPGCARSSATCTTAPRSGWPRWP